VADPQRLNGLNQPGADVLRRIAALASSLTEPTMAKLLERLRDDPDIRHIEKLAAGEPPILDTDKADAAAKELDDALNTMARDADRARAAEAVLRLTPRH
jgi:hypothetical protein